MNWIKKIFASPYLKSLKGLAPSGGWATAGYLIAVFLLALLIFLLIFLIIKRRKKANASEPAVQEDLLTPKSLVNVWKLFLKQIPAQFRRSIMMYQPYIVLGEAGTGKSSLIDLYSDWKNQANQFYPSYTQDALFQIFLGSRIIVQEIPAALLHDTSASTRKALVKLWKCFKRKKDLTIVITIKGDALLNDDPDFLKEQAQMIRGKINILSQILRQPVNIKVALTFMDYIEGFSEFSVFLKNNNMPFELEIGDNNKLNDLENFIKPYEKFFVNALVSETPLDYLKIISFCKNAPVVLSGLSRFLRILTDPDSLSSSPCINSIFFTADSLDEDKPLSNPFKSHVSIKKVRSYQPLKKHKIAAGVIVIAGMGYMLFSYYYKLDNFQNILSDFEKINISMMQSDQALNQMGNESDRILNKTMVESDQTLDDLESESKKILDNRFLIDFFPDAETGIYAQVIETRKKLQGKIVQKFLEPKLTPLNVQEDAYKKNLLILALIYASNSNELGNLIKNNMEFWVATCSIPQHIITNYISLSDHPWEGTIPLKGLVEKSQSDIPQRDRSWLLFLNNVERIQNQTFISPQAFSALQKQAVKLIGEIDTSRQVDQFDQVWTLLSQDTVLANQLSPFIPVQNTKVGDTQGYAEFKKFLNFFWHLKFDPNEVGVINLEQLFENLRVMMEYKTPEEKFNFVINEKSFYFSSDKLNKLLTKSSMVMLLKKFISHYSQNPGMSFFQSDSEYNNLVVGTSSGNNFYFSNKMTIDGKYTKASYTKYVMPVLKEFPALLEKLPVDGAEKTLFSNFMFREVDTYITNYLNTYEAYYKGFKIDADSVGELRYILTQMTLPLSQFQDFLMVLNDNLSLEYGDNAYFDLIKSKLRPLGFISLLMQPKNDQFPGLEKYKAILRQVLVDLLSNEPPAATGDDNSLTTLKTMLPPEARIGLDIFLEGPNSYFKMIQKWGTSVGISEEWLYPFTSPVFQAYLLGQQKIETITNQEWGKLETTYINPVIEKFPFNPSAQSPVTPEDLKNLAYPTGKFWKKFSDVIAPLCKKDQDGNWQERKFAKVSLKYPSNMFKELNCISQLSRTLFNEKGEPQPLKFDVQAQILPQAQKNQMFVVLSYVRSGKNTVFGFNQQPSWHQFSFDWWKQESASVGVELMQTQKKSAPSGKNFTTIGVPNSYWSFYRLLGKADSVKSLTWTWNIESPGVSQLQWPISFSVKKDPWTIFQEMPFKGKNKK
ncbi:MAG: hypothetical protein GY710_04885 [Desulfobacteraceae bacterium]|nr:hypothetical protein [Desulfobacteraceae bacterium]